GARAASAAARALERVHSVVQDVHAHFQQLVFIAQHSRQLRIEQTLKSDVVGREVHLLNAQRVVEQGIEVEQLLLFARGLLREVLQAGSDGFGAARLLLDLFRKVAQLFRKRRIRSQKLGVAVHGGQR